MTEAVRNYVNDNWKFWILAIVGTIAVLILGGIGDADAKPVLRKTVDTVQFYQDREQGTWFMQYRDNVTDMEEDFKNIKVVWHGTYNNTPLILIAGEQDSQCPMNFQLYRFMRNGDVRQAKGFGTCNAQNVTVEIDGTYVIINFDGMTKRVPLQ
ncbi:hypothetical protein AVU38_gp015 [Ralstonia phage RSL2]|uniref:Uncharacterized protein n=1 Tax=Ralstonia phage RSL2 TaxID=1585840 RepID=A0A0A8J954_9CAUD|nr:hypothetical protein AVU38_gp015 [Ralstonia phage RSL2]BAQ02543.1 hypothetical protein [Ralstonia phage RSL2]